MKNADLIVKGATIFAGKNLPDDYEFVAIKGNKILSCGYLDEMDSYIGNDTKIIEADKDKLLMPGFFDSHVHLIMAGMYQLCVNLDSSTSAEDAARMVVEYAKTIPDNEWIIGFRWYHLYWEDKSLPTAEILDRYIPDRPVFLMNSECHGAWVNSKAMELCGITKDTPDPEFGRIERYENGEPTGYLEEYALGLVGKHAFNMSVDEERKYINYFQDRCAEFGITSITDVMPFFGIKFGSYETFNAMDKDQSLKIRIHGAPDLIGDMDEVLNAGKKYNSDMYRITSVKQFLDGVATTFTALLVEPYSDDPSTTGSTLMDLDKLNGYVEEAHKRGLSVKLHACGDGSLRAALDAYENAIKKYGDTGARHAIEHDEVIHPDDLNRFAELGVIASMQPEHIAITDDFASNGYTEKLGPERCVLTWPIKSLMDTGAVVCFGTDCPVVTNDPYLEIYRSLTRIYNDGLPEGGWNPQEKVSIVEALDAYTYGSAYAVSRENELGTLEPGKFADIIMVDRNLLKVSPDEVRKANTLMTIQNGKIVYER